MNNAKKNIHVLQNELLHKNDLIFTWEHTASDLPQCQSSQLFHHEREAQRVWVRSLLLCDSNFRQTKIYQFNGRARIHGYTLVHTLRLSKSGLWPACRSTRQQQTRPSSLPSRAIPLASNKQNFFNTLWIKDMDRIQLGQALPFTMLFLPGITRWTNHPLSTPDPANLKRKRLVNTKDLIWAPQKRVIQKYEKKVDIFVCRSPLLLSRPGRTPRYLEEVVVLDNRSVFRACIAFEMSFVPGFHVKTCLFSDKTSCH